jgi:hypothetical protein
VRNTEIAAVSFFVLLGCATTAIEDPAIRRATAGVELVESKPTREFEILKEVTGVSCARQIGSSPSIEAARQNMKVEAGKIGADAVVNIACEENNNVSWKHNCWKSTECRGDAVKWRTTK